MDNIKSEARLLVKHSLIYGMGPILNRSTGILLLPIYTRFLTPRDYGIKELVALSVSILNVLVSTTLSNAFYRFYCDTDDRDKKNRIISTALVGVGLTGLLFVTLAGLISRPLAALILDSPELNIYLLLAFASLWFQALESIVYSWMRAEYKSALLVTASYSRLLFAAVLNIVFIVVMKMGVVSIFLSTLINSVLFFAVLTLPLLYRVGLKPSWPMFKEMFRFGVPFVPAQLGAFVVHMSDRFFVKAYHSIESAGLYSLGYRIGTLPGEFAAQPFNQAWVPRRYETMRKPDAKSIFARMFTYYVLGLSALGLAVSVLAREVLMVMSDPKFWEAYKVVPIIVVANIVFQMSTHVGFGMMVEKKTRYFGYINVSNAGLNLAFNFLLIPGFGAYGAAIATLLSFVYKTGLSHLIGDRYFRIPYENGRLLKIAVTALALYGASWSLHLPSPFLSLLCKGLLLCAFPVVLYFWKFFTAEELAFAGDTLRRLRPAWAGSGA